MPIKKLKINSTFKGDNKVRGKKGKLTIDSFQLIVSKDQGCEFGLGTEAQHWSSLEVIIG